jgi:hypothetical protein
MRRLVPVIAVVLVTAATGCSGGTEEVSRDASNRSTTTARDDQSDVDTSDPSSDTSAEDAAADAPVEDPGSDDAGSATGSTGTRPGRSGTAGAGAPDASGEPATPGATPGAGGSDDATGPPSTAPFRPDPDRYDTYVGLARQYGGEVATREDATGLASVLCSDPAGARAEFLDGQPLGTYPSDLAIVRAYCPDKEPLF